jgi:hypothetical protein
MWKKALTVALLINTPAQACHKYSTWHYKFPQTCSTKFVAMYVPKIRLKDPPRPLVPPKLSPIIQILNDKLTPLLKPEYVIPDIPVDILYVINSIDEERKAALGKLRDRLR